MAAIKGVGVIWSVGAITYAGGIVLAAGEAAMAQSVAFSRTSEKAEVKDNQGIIRGQIFSGFKKTATITVVPASTTATPSIAEAQSAGNTLMPQAGTSVTLTDDSGAILDATYNIISVRQNRTVDGVATIDLELETGDEGNDITTLVS